MTGQGGVQVNNGHLPPHVVPYCLVGAVLAALLPIGAYLMQASGNVEGSQSGGPNSFSLLMSV